MKNLLRFTLIFLILFLASILRFWQLGQVPPSPDWDEVALGYNAYSIMFTGKDEYGKTFPIILRSFDDYKPALYTYFVIPFIKLFDLTIVAVRLPSAIFGIFAVLASYFLVKELFKRDSLALLVSFILAISPWHIQFSRIAFESNVGLAFNIFGVLCFLLGLRRPWILLLSALLLALNLYVYQSEKVFVPLLLIVLVVIFRKELFALPKKYLVIAMFLGLSISLPTVNYTLTNREALSRAQGVSILADPTPLLRENAQRILVDRENKDILGLVLDNRRIFYVKTAISGYLSHFDLNWLFITGDLPRHHAPNMGLLYLWELPFLLIGIYMLAFGAFDKKAKLIIFLWLLIAPIPASITSGVPHAVRTLNFLPTLQIFTAIGVLTAFQSISNIKYKIVKIHIKYLIFTLYFLFFMFNFSYYINQYFVQQNYFASVDWQYGYKEVIETVKKIENKYRRIIVSNEPHLDQSYMFFLFYLKYPPNIYQEEARFASGGFRETHRFGKFEFRPVSWDNEKKEKGILFVGRPLDFPQIDLGHVKTINFLDGKLAIKIVEGYE